MVVSEDGRKLWLFGGNNGHGSLNDLYSFDIDSCMWCQVMPQNHHHVEFEYVDSSCFKRPIRSLHANLAIRLSDN